MSKYTNNQLFPKQALRLVFVSMLVWFCGARLMMAQEIGAGWRQKVDPWVLVRAQRSEGTEFVAFLTEQSDLSEVPRLGTKAEKGNFVFAALTRTAERTQQPLIDFLRTRGAPFRAFWIANMVWSKGGLDLIETIAQREDVQHIFANPKVGSDIPRRPEAADTGRAKRAIEENITHVGAEFFWNAGFYGQGVVIGGQDTGYDWDHPALIDQYRGWDGMSADHNYNWHDAIHSGGGFCGANSPEPCGDLDHGTHTMGTMIGDDGGANQIGMAPGAQWMGCRNMDIGAGTPTTYSECFEWFVAPTDLAGENPDPSKAPHVINNSWSCPFDEGCVHPGMLQTVVANTRAAGILVVVSAGNDGSACESVFDQPATYEESFTVGATNNDDEIALFSSRGPVTVDASGRIKPDVSAPGVSIRSSLRFGLYGFNSGTSMAGPHVAGLAALILSAAPCLIGHVDELEEYIIDTAIPQTTAQTCGGVSGMAIPNNTFGHGTIAALLPDQQVCSFLSLFGDGFEMGSLMAWPLVTP